MNLVINDTWSLYHHCPMDEDWTYKSYLKLKDISDTDAFWMANQAIQESFTNGIYFLMREHIFPCWDDEYNVSGGCFAMKILKKDCHAFWEKICINLLGENTLKEEKRHLWENINGISVSPKKYFCIVKIWVKNNNVIEEGDLNIPTGYHGDILYKSNF